MDVRLFFLGADEFLPRLIISRIRALPKSKKVLRSLPPDTRTILMKTHPYSQRQNVGRWFWFLEIQGICGYSLEFLGKGRQTTVGCRRWFFVVFVHEHVLIYRPRVLRTFNRKSHYALSISTKINELGWHWTARTSLLQKKFYNKSLIISRILALSKSKKVLRSPLPATRTILMKTDPHYQRQNVGRWFSFLEI